jgi:Mg2+ and Co2+ transporter CorA
MYTHLLSRYIKHYEYSVRNIQERLHDEDMIDLQRWRRRSKQSSHKLTLLSEYVKYWIEHEDDQKRWEMVLKDIDFICAQLDHQSRSLEQMVPIAMSMVQLKDASNIQRMTYIALIFVPLSWVASVFSMSEGYGPGDNLFWVYFVVAAPIVLVVLILAWQWQALRTIIRCLRYKLPQ